MGIAGLCVTVAVIALGVIDLALVIYGYVNQKTTESTISNFLIQLGFRSPFTVFVFGYVAGHLFGYMYPASCPPVTANIFAPNFWMILFFTTVAALIVVLTRLFKQRSEGKYE